MKNTTTVYELRMTMPEGAEVGSFEKPVSPTNPLIILARDLRENMQEQLNGASIQLDPAGEIIADIHGDGSLMVGRTKIQPDQSLRIFPDKVELRLQGEWKVIAWTQESLRRLNAQAA